MSQDLGQIKQTISEDLKKGGIHNFLHSQPNISEPLIVLPSYTPRVGKPTMGIILALNSVSLSRKYWCTNVNILKQNGPKRHPDYKEVEIEGVIYYPFSAAIDCCQCNAYDISKCIRDIYYLYYEYE